MLDKNQQEMLKKKYSFFQHRECEWFPCHKTNDPEHFNCLFCYCPLYALGDKCGGNFKYSYGYKDCSDCMFPHVHENYPKILERFAEIAEMVKQKTDTDDTEL